MHNQVLFKTILIHIVLCLKFYLWNIITNSPMAILYLKGWLSLQQCIQVRLRPRLAQGSATSESSNFLLFLLSSTVCPLHGLKVLFFCIQNLHLLSQLHTHKMSSLGRSIFVVSLNGYLCICEITLESRGDSQLRRPNQFSQTFSHMDWLPCTFKAKESLLL